MFGWLKSPIRTGFLVIWSLLRWPKYCLIGLTVLVWRPVADASCKILLGDDPCDLEPEALDKASIITPFNFHILKVVFECWLLLVLSPACLYKRAFNYLLQSFTQASCPTMCKLLLRYHTFLTRHGAPVPPVCFPGCMHWYVHTWGSWCSSSHLGKQLRNISICAISTRNTGQSTETLIKIPSQGQK